MALGSMLNSISDIIFKDKMEGRVLHSNSIKIDIASIILTVSISTQKFCDKQTLK